MNETVKVIARCTFQSGCSVTQDLKSPLCAAQRHRSTTVSTRPLSHALLRKLCDTRTVVNECTQRHLVWCIFFDVSQGNKSSADPCRLRAHHCMLYCAVRCSVPHFCHHRRMQLVLHYLLCMRGVLYCFDLLYTRAANRFEKRAKHTFRFV